MPRIESETDPQRRWRLIRLLRQNIGVTLLPVLIRLMRDYTHLRMDIQTKIECLCYYHSLGHHAIIVSQGLYDETKEALDYAKGYVPWKLASHIYGIIRVKK